MSEHESIALAERFARYRTEVLAEIEPPGPAAVRRTVRLRRRRTFGSAVAAALALTAGPILGYAALDGPTPRPGPVDPTASPTPSLSASATASPTASPVASSASPTGAAPNGRISRAQLLATPVSLPAWSSPAGCPTKGVRLAAEPVKDDTNALIAVDHGDLDGDGATETVALVRCVFGTRGPAQVIAFDRDAAGEVVTLGRVIGTGRPAPGWLTALDVRADGEVRVELLDIAPGGGWPEEYSQRQWRGYRWTGDGFEQVSGPTGFGPNPNSADLGLVAGDLVLTTATDGSRSGSFTVRVRNDGDRTVRDAVLQLELPTALELTGDGWAGCDQNRHATLLVFCHLTDVESRREVRLTLDVKVAAGVSLTPGQAPLRVWPEGPGGHNMLETDSSDNEVTIDYR
ncbi:hypothetical protein AB0C04_19840 [Micromonospora sp. NPDC048909]|uniref:hypothetical protein n=1 Tax=Micromonospora sp. NPDC048909 TaxID=3155643 RepID=UPI0033CCB123